MCFLRNYVCANPCENLRNLCKIIVNMDVIRTLSEVTPCLYVSAGCAITDSKLQELGINLIINSTAELDNYHPPEESNIQVIRIPVKDLSDTELAPYFKVVIKFSSFFFFTFEYLHNIMEQARLILQIHHVKVCCFYRQLQI